MVGSLQLLDRGGSNLERGLGDVVVDRGGTRFTGERAAISANYSMTRLHSEDIVAGEAMSCSASAQTTIETFLTLLTTSLLRTPDLPLLCAHHAVPGSAGRVDVDELSILGHECKCEYRISNISSSTDENTAPESYDMATRAVWGTRLSSRSLFRVLLQSVRHQGFCNLMSALTKVYHLCLISISPSLRFPTVTFHQLSYNSKSDYTFVNQMLSD